MISLEKFNFRFIHCCTTEVKSMTFSHLYSLHCSVFTEMRQSGALVIRDQVRDHDVSMLESLLCHKEPEPMIGPFRARKPPIPNARRIQSPKAKYPHWGVICLLLFGIKESWCSNVMKIFQFYKDPDQ